MTCYVCKKALEEVVVFAPTAKEHPLCQTCARQIEVVAEVVLERDGNV